MGDLAAFAVRQEAAVSVCDARRQATVEIIEAHNGLIAQVQQQLKPRKWWWPF